MLRVLILLALAQVWTFDGAPPGEAANWQVGHAPGSPYVAEVVDIGGERGVMLRPADPRNARFGSAAMRLDAAEYAGKRLRLTADTSTFAVGSLQFAVLGDDGPTGQRTAPLEVGQGRQATLVAEVPAGATALLIGVSVQGGVVVLDRLEIEVVGNIGEGDVPPGELSDAQVDRLVKLADLIALVRYFHPADGVESADMDLVAVELIRRSLDEEADLAEVVAEVLGPVAPEVVVGDAAVRYDVPEAGVWTGWRRYGPPVGNVPYGGRSERVKWPKGERPEGVPAEGSVGRVALSEEVSVLVPLSLPTRQAASGLEPATRGVPGWAPSPNDLPTRLAATIAIYNHARHFYPYRDALAGDLTTRLRRALREAARARDTREATDAMCPLLAAFNDGHGVLHHGSVPRQLPLPLRMQRIGDEVVITAAGNDTGFVAGDVVTAIDGVKIDQAIRNAGVSASTPWHRDRRALERLLRRERAEDVAVTAGGKSVILRPAPLPPESMRGPVEEVEEDLWYIDLGRATSKQLDPLWPELAGARGVVFDMRGYPRLDMIDLLAHLADEPVTAMPMAVPVITRPSFQGVTWDESAWTVQPVEPTVGGRVVWLTGPGTISAAETLSIIVDEYDLATLVGQPTAGTNGNIAQASLPGGWTLIYTGMRVTRHDGSPFHGVGVVPDVVVEPAVGRDAVLEKALEIAGSDEESEQVEDLE